MSGHNPSHGRLGQPNPSSWNPLQVPSYIPRQPQLAHIASSSESATRSPLAWHATHQEQLYNFMTANKNQNLDINPLLSTFGRPPAMSLGGGSVDLTISTASRNTPSPKNLNPPLPPPNLLGNGPGSFIVSNETPSFTNPSSILNMLSNRSPPVISSSPSIISPSPGVIQSTAAIMKEQTQQHLNNGKSDQNVPGGLYVKDAKQINKDYVGQPHVSESTEKMKDLILHAIQNNPIPISPRRNSPIRSPLLPNQSPSRSRSPPTAIKQNTELLSTSIVHNVPSSNANVPVINCDMPPATQSPSPILNNNNASNDDSIDSSSSKRRKRKPNKTTKIENEPAASSSIVINEEDDDFNNSLCDTLSTVTTVTITAKSAPTPTPSAPEIIEIEDEPIVEEKGSKTPSAEDIIKENGEKSEHKNEPVNMEISDEDVVEKVQPKNRKKQVKSASPAVVAKKAKGVRKRKDTKNTDSDDVETIDKISAMISSTAQEENENKAENKKPCNGLLDILETATVVDEEKVVTAKKKKKKVVKKVEKMVEKSETPVDSDKFEDIENKLQEMFAEDPQEPEPKTTPALAPVPVPVPTPKPSAPSSPKNESINEQFDKNERSPSPPPVVPKKAAVKKAVTGKGNTSAPKKRKKIIKKKKKLSPNARNVKASPTNNKKNAKNSGKFSAPASSTSTNVKTKTKSEASSVIEAISKYKGPYIQVKADGTQNVINTPFTEEAPDKGQNKTKKIAASHHHHHSNADKSKIRGLHVSTLSMKYDADTTDKTWMCVFCKQGPHKSRLGDLFGPYFITTTSSDFEFSQEDPETDPFNVKRTRESLAAKHKIYPEPESSPSSPKKKRKIDKNHPQSTMEPIPCSSNSLSSNGMPDIFHGMVKSGDASYEVWVHEDCLTWAPGVYVVGTRVIGLEGAIWTCTRHRCSICSNYGAVINCLHKGCPQEAHVSCARSCQWTLDEEFKCKCELHNNDVMDSS